ncbi:MAG TPA: hypothetical protein VKW78_16155 [Terriglobales bacterium]|nr:hypothetical protein [Terriglobales bacterium]
MAERVFWSLGQQAKDRIMTERGKDMVMRSVYIALGLLAARWIFRRKPETDLLARLRAAGI